MNEEHALHIGLVLVGAPAIAFDALEHGTFGVRATIALIMTVLGASAIVRNLLGKRATLPRARVRPARHRRGR